MNLERGFRRLAIVLSVLVLSLGITFDAMSLWPKIWWLNVWLLVFTIAIFGLTSVLAWATLRAVVR